MLKQKFNYLLPADVNWEVFVGNILDNNLVESLKNKGDIVYSWGVLHHTGNMWKAIENASKLVKSDGYFIIAIYNHAPSSEFWLKVKEFYNAHPIIQPLLIALYGGYATLGFMIRRKTLNLRRERGMHVFYNAVDWLGGLPYEFACFEEVKEYVERLGFSLINAPTKLPWCNEFVFEKA